jgi:hypothetical protein
MVIGRNGHPEQCRRTIGPQLGDELFDLSLGHFVICLVDEDLLGPFEILGETVEKQFQPSRFKGLELVRITDGSQADVEQDSIGARREKILALAPPQVPSASEFTGDPVTCGH